MKNLISIIIICLVLSCCSKDGKLGSSANDQLPPETQTGANTVGCLVNGKVFLPKAEGINPEVNCFYQLVGGEYFFTMAFADLRGTGRIDTSVQTFRINLEAGLTYILNKNSVLDGDFTGGAGSYSTALNNEYNTTATKNGEFRITKLDPANSIISGTFWFDAINASGEVVEIRQGRFDWRY